MGNAMSPLDQEVNDGIDQATVTYVDKIISLSGLSKTAADVLAMEMNAFTSESPHLTGQEIADHVGCSREWVYRVQKDSRYLAAKDKIQDVWFRSQAGSVYAAVLTTAREGKVGAQKLALEVMGKHVTRVESRNVNISADMTTDGALDLDNAIDKFLVMIGNRGWSLEMLADRWRDLKSSQAF